MIELPEVFSLWKSQFSEQENVGAEVVQIETLTYTITTERLGPKRGITVPTWIDILEFETLVK
jgi:hypothetical protein